MAGPAAVCILARKGESMQEIVKFLPTLLIHLLKTLTYGWLVELIS